MTEPKAIGAILSSGKNGNTQNREAPKQAGVKYRPIRSHDELVQRAAGKVQRLIKLGAPEWLIERERVAQRRGFTVVRSRSTGAWYDVPLDTEDDRTQRILDSRANRKAGEEAERIHKELGIWEEDEF